MHEEMRGGCGFLEIVLAGHTIGFLDVVMNSWVERELERVVKAQESGEWERAEMGLSKILSKHPKHAEANYRMGCMAFDAGYVEDALRHVEICYAAEPKDKRYGRLMVLVSKTLAKLAQRAGEWRRIVDYLDRPVMEDDPEVLGWLATAYYRLGRMDECREVYHRRMDLLPPMPQVYSQWIGLQAGNPRVDACGFFDVAARWDEQFGRKQTAYPKRDHQRALRRGKRLRIGLVSPTFYHHANANFLLPLVEQLDRSVFEVFAYHDGQRKDMVTERFVSGVDVFRSIAGMDVPGAAQVIEQDELDLLVDINGHFDESRMEIYTYRPAPLQVHYLGGVGPTGLESMDWRMADEVTEPDEGDTESRGERIFRMGGGIHAYRPLLPTAEVIERPDALNVVRLGCMNALHKMERPVLELWGRILLRHPEARLVLVKEVFRKASTREDFLARVGSCGIPREQVELKAPGAGMDFDDLSVYQGIDMALDTFPYNGITTTCEALWMGVPVVTLMGNRFVAREAAALLKHSGMGEWVADTEEAYMRIVDDMIEARGEIGSERRERAMAFRAGPCCDAERLAREWERFMGQH